VTQPAAPGRVLGNRYRIVERLARGGMATVWIAEDTLLARRVAVKTLLPELAVDDDLRARFRNEAISAASVSHPGIVATYDTGDDDGVAYIVMELVDGPTLRRLLDDKGRLPPGEAVRIARGIAVALDQAHRGGIVHRDVKPANVLVPAEGPVKVTDFGIAKGETSGDLTRTGTVLGTARYLAPEQVRGDPADPRSDVYAVGLVLYEMLAGRLPFGGDTEMATALARLTVAPAPLPAGVPPALTAIVQRALALEPADRYQSAHALADALDAVAEVEDIPLAPAPAPPPPPPRDATATGARTVAPPAPPRGAPARATKPRRAPARRKSSWPFALLGALLVVAGVAGGYWLLKDVIDGGSLGGGGTSLVTPSIAGATDFDPEGGDGEHPETVQRVIPGADGSWTTETYSSTDVGGKSGVGLYLTLTGPADISAVEVDADASGWSAQIYVADTPSDTLAGWGEPVAAGENLGPSARFTVDPPRRGSAVLVWITHLPDSRKLAIAEVRVA
jgi:eukaryotic-like serine/threonine-protein kinase